MSDQEEHNKQITQLLSKISAATAGSHPMPLTIALVNALGQVIPHLTPGDRYGAFKTVGRVCMDLMEFLSHTFAKEDAQSKIAIPNADQVAAILKGNQG